MATRSSVLAWRIPGTGEPGGLPSMGSHRVGHDWRDLAAAAGCLFIHCFLLQIVICGGFPGGPVVETSPSSAGGTGSIPGLHAMWLKKQNVKNRSNIVTHSIKTEKNQIVVCETCEIKCMTTLKCNWVRQNPCLLYNYFRKPTSGILMLCSFKMTLP